MLKINFTPFAIITITITLLALVGKSTSQQNSSSCVGKCGQGVNSTAPCQCNSACQAWNDCCDDYIDVCIGTCANKCGLDSPGAICACRNTCIEAGNCCPDFHQLCGVSDDNLKSIVEELLSLDVNNAVSFVQFNLDSNPMLIVNESVYGIPTIAKLNALLDNYIPEVQQTENMTAERLIEERAFWDSIFNTSIMARTQSFLAENGYPNNRSTIERIWFGLYNRGGGILGSSGFEHVFVGELWDNDVSGLHGWLYFAKEEAAGHLINGGIRNYINFEKGWVVENYFCWHSACKPIGGGFIGTSPELELALYTICWLTRPNSLCSISLNGRSLYLQTYVTTASHSTQGTYISTSYTVIP